MKTTLLARTGLGRILIFTLAVSATLSNQLLAEDDLLLLADEPESDLLSDDNLLLTNNTSGDDLLSGEDDLLTNDDLLVGDDLLANENDLAGDLLSQPAEVAVEVMEDAVADAAAAHAALFAEDRFPSATTCATCHPDHYEEWSVSSHAYSQMSPIFNAMHAKIVKLTNGTNGDFCIRCHTQVGMQLEEPVFMSNLERNPTSREGITCIVCHRVSNNYGKVSGRTSLEEGDVFAPVFGPEGGAVLAEVLANRDKFKVNADPNKNGRNIHAEAIVFEPISTSGFCGSCQDVNLLNGFRLEEAFSQYKNTEASKRGESCQDCHMGTVPGIASGYEEGPAAVVGGIPTKARKRTNHMFAGPDYSIVHPGIFPHNTKAQELATLAEWLEFDYEAGWGTRILRTTFHLMPLFLNAGNTLRTAKKPNYSRSTIQASGLHPRQRYQVPRRAYQLGELVVDEDSDKKLRFKIKVKNGTDGHAVPTGFDAERLVYLHVRVKDKDGKLVFESGDRDPNGDVRDLHSAYVHNWELPIDNQLFTLQSKFITRMQRGGEREQILAVNYSPDPLPYIRPEGRPTILAGRPSAVRNTPAASFPLPHAEQPIRSDKSIGNGGPYSLEVEMISQMVPVNLIRSPIWDMITICHPEIADQWSSTPIHWTSKRPSIKRN